MASSYCNIYDTDECIVKRQLMVNSYYRTSTQFPWICLMHQHVQMYWYCEIFIYVLVIMIIDTQRICKEKVIRQSPIYRYGRHCIIIYSDALDENLNMLKTTVPENVEHPTVWSAAWHESASHRCIPSIRLLANGGQIIPIARLDTFNTIVIIQYVCLS